MRDLVKGKYKHADYGEVLVRDGTSCGFEKASAKYVDEVLKE